MKLSNYFTSGIAKKLLSYNSLQLAINSITSTVNLQSDDILYIEESCGTYHVYHNGIRLNYQIYNQMNFFEVTKIITKEIDTNFTDNSLIGFYVCIKHLSRWNDLLEAIAIGSEFCETVSDINSFNNLVDVLKIDKSIMENIQDYIACELNFETNRITQHYKILTDAYTKGLNLVFIE